MSILSTPSRNGRSMPLSSVVDPDPDVFGPSGSGFFHPQAKKVIKS
jgi:hypothetical protein